MFSEQYQKNYTALCEISKRHSAASPLVPYVGDLAHVMRGEFGVAPVMWCGAATDGWGNDSQSPASARESQNMTRHYLLHDMKPNKSSFWRAMAQCSRILSGTLAEPLPLSIAMRSWFVWNNLWKVGGACGNPEEALRSEQIDLSVAQFWEECAVVKPEHVVLHVGELANEMIEALTGSIEADWVHASASVWVKEANGLQFHWAARKRDALQASWGEQVALTILKSRLEWYEEIRP